MSDPAPEPVEPMSRAKAGPESGYVVDRCICAGLTLEQLRSTARESDPPLSYEALRARTGCGIGCALCEPYVRAMLRNGRTEFPLGGANA